MFEHLALLGIKLCQSARLIHYLLRYAFIHIDCIQGSNDIRQKNFLVLVSTGRRSHFTKRIHKIFERSIVDHLNPDHAGRCSFDCIRSLDETRETETIKRNEFGFEFLVGLSLLIVRRRQHNRNIASGYNGIWCQNLDSPIVSRIFFCSLSRVEVDK